MEHTQRLELMQRYRDGYQAVLDALEGASAEALDRPAGDGWSARMVAHHLADSEMTSAMRLRKLLCEPTPVLWGYDEELYSRKLWYTVRPIEVSLLAFRGARESTASLFEHLTEEDWGAKAGIPKAAVTPPRRGSKSTPPTRWITPPRSAVRSGEARSRGRGSCGHGHPGDGCPG
jgi:hypothetical protein